MLRGQRAIADEMAQRLGTSVSPALVGYWRQAGAPISADYAADPDQVESWYRVWITRNQSGAGAAPGEGGGSKIDRAKQAYQLKILVQRERRLRLENEEREGSLIRVADAERTYGALLARLMAHLEHLPGNLAGALVGQDAPAIRARLRAAIRQARAVASRPIDLAGHDDDPLTADAADPINDSDESADPADRSAPPPVSSHPPPVASSPAPPGLPSVETDD